ncbi:probable cytochrome b561 [Fulvimarina pelagi HTCC2506]|uniref:Probable cytochrome b561 n=1 Tax=Fulvimarina pelagi HTCC2506 TaxID=314231 RepID=Q0G7D8_9HYPH|nr:cytochrome b [Fulvimarina pelagi]EAU42426.1 probable cytochrome b561 [Fulvimarina pelagi HTCC2506]
MDQAIYNKNGIAEGLPQEARYAPTARVFHWIVAVMVLVVWPFGMVIKFIAEDSKPIFYLLHESFGFLILWIMLARVAVRLVRGAPAHPPMPEWQRRLADTVHVLLYVALIAMPIFGFLATNAFGFPLSLFGLIPIPSPVGKNDALAGIFMTVHVTLGYTILVLFLLHMAGVLQHHVLKRDATLYRMT